MNDKNGWKFCQKLLFTKHKIAMYSSDHKFNCSKFLQVLLLDETLNGMSSNKMKIKREWINMFNHCGGSNPQYKWLITFSKFVLKCHPKVLDSNERTNIQTRWKGCHKGSTYSKGHNQESNFICKIIMYELVFAPYNIIQAISIQDITFKTSTQHFLL
jgi:hypothetical protein